MNFPQGTEDLLKLLGAGAGHGHEPHEKNAGAAAAAKQAHLADEQLFQLHRKAENQKDIELDPHKALEAAQSNENEAVGEYGAEPNRSAKTILKKALPYFGVFVFALLFYFVFFTNFSVSSLFNFRSTPKVSEKNTATYQNLGEYNAWIRSFYFQVNDQSILAPDYDISGNGLTNYQKFVLGLNPKKTDTLGLGIADTRSVLEGINPATGNPYTDKQKEIIAQYVDLEAAANKLSLNAAKLSGQIAGANTNDRGQIDFTIDQNIPGIIEIPSIAVRAPLIWTTDAKNFDKDLQNGVVHYPGTALPGEIGTSYISGHSSNYSWAKGSYNKIFEKLGDVKKYDSFSITVTTTAGKNVVFHYVIDASGIFKADDQAQFANVGRASVALSTCWPIGTSQKRLVLFGALSQIDK